MTRSIFLLGCLILLLPVRGAPVPPPDAFLDARMPKGALPLWNPHDWRIPDERPNCVMFASFRDRLAAVRKWMPRPLVLPPGLTSFVAEVDSREDPKDSLLSPFQDERCGLGGESLPTYRSFLNDSCMLMGLRAHYEPKEDALVADFTWHREDDRSSHELLRVLATTKPLATDEVGWPKDENRSVDSNSLDPWRIALDALISKPENYSRAWKLRFVDDTKGASLCPCPGSIRWSGWLLNGRGKRQFVIIKYHPTFSMPGPTGSYVCYEFDDHGKFVGGALINDRYENVSTPDITLAATGDRLDLSVGTASVGTMSFAPKGIVLTPHKTYAGDLLGEDLYRVQ